MDRYIPFDQLPNAYDPPSGILATANGRITPDGYPNIVSFEWDASVRTQRIYRYLQADKNFTPADMLALRRTSTLTSIASSRSVSPMPSTTASLLRLVIDRPPTFFATGMASSR